MELKKYPRTCHLPWSPGKTADDITASDLSELIKSNIVVTEKMDGENTTMTASHIHARSLNYASHPSRDYVRRLWVERVMGQIPSDMKVCGENVYAEHSIHYNGLPDYFLVFGIYVEDTGWLAWSDVIEWAQILELSVAPVLYQGRWNEQSVKECYTGQSLCGGLQEGYVVRSSGVISSQDFNLKVAKYVRANHVTTEQHWMRKSVVPNEKREK